MAGRLAASIIEARNVDGDTQAEPCFYVRLRVAGSEAKTDKVVGSLAPKFLKDLRLEVPDPEDDCLSIELLQAGPRGDLVVGCEDIRIAPLTAQGTLVHWFALKNAAQRIGAELCVVLRYAASSRPASPFTIPAHPEGQRQGAASPHLSRQQSKSMRSLSPVVAADLSRAATPQPPTPVLKQKLGGADLLASPESAALAGAAARPHRRHRSRRAAQQQVPTPLAVAGGVLLGALTYLWKARSVYYEVQPGDAVCSIGACALQQRSDQDSSAAAPTRRRPRPAVPDIIFPGDRLRIK